MVNKARVLVFGGSGQVGGYLSDLISKSDRFELANDRSERFELSRPEMIDEAVRASRPDWVVNAAAYTAVDKAESDQDQCFLVNAHAPGQMALACREIGARFIHYSTDYVFSGLASVPYKEGDATDPFSVYGKSKLAGEQAVLGSLPEALVLRTAWVYARTGKNFVNTMLRLAKSGGPINVVSDQVGCPTFAWDLARVTLDLMDQIFSEKTAHQGGVFHTTGQGQTNWYDFCRQIMFEAGFTQVQVNAITTDEYPTPAPRPRYSVLDNAKLQQVYGLSLPDWRQALSSLWQADNKNG